MHPLEIIKDILDGVPLAASQINASAFDPSDAAYSGISHYVCTRGFLPGLEMANPTKVLDSVNELAELMNGHITTNEDGKIDFGLFDPSAAAVDHWGPDVLTNFKQRPLDDNIRNRIIVQSARHGENDYRQITQRNDTDSQGYLAHPDEAERIVSDVLSTPWLDATDIAVFDGGNMQTTWTQVGLFGAMGSFCGCRVPSNWPTVAQAADAQLSATRPAYIAIDNEIIKCAAALTLNEGGGLFGIEHSPIRATYNPISRGQLGTSNVYHAAGAPEDAGLDYWRVRDMTIAVAIVDARLERFGQGAPVVELDTPLHKSWVQYGDLITIEAGDFVGFGYDGIVEGDGKWEVILREINPHDNPASVHWVLMWATETSPTSTYGFDQIERVFPDSFDEAPESLSTMRPFTTDGLVLTAGLGLVADMTAGVFGVGYKDKKLDSYSGHVFTASRDTYVISNLRMRVLRFEETALGAGAPDLYNGETLIAKVVTDGSAITSIDQSEMPVKPFDVGRILNAAFAIYLNTPFSAPKTTLSPIPFDTTEYDVGPTGPNVTGSGTFVVPEDGTYTFRGCCVLQAYPAGFYCYMALHVNAGYKRWGTQLRNDSGATRTMVLPGAFGDIELSKNDVVDVRVYNADNNSITVKKGAHLTYFCGRQIR